MKVEFDRSFERSLSKIRTKSVFSKIEELIIELEKTNSLSELPSIVKLSGFKNYYRARIGVYRVGIEKINEDTIRFIIVAHRKDINKSFPNK